MNAQKCYKQLQNDQMNDIRFLHTFIDDRAPNHFDSVSCEDMLDYFNKYTNMYFPFDNVTCISELRVPNTTDGDNEPRLTAVTFQNNPSKDIDSKVYFHCLFNTVGVMTGFIQFCQTKLMTNEFIDNIRRANPNDVVYYTAPSDNEDPNAYNPIICSKKFIMKDHRTKRTARGNSVNDLIAKRYLPDGGGPQLVNIFADKVLFAWLYFAQLVIDPKLFIVEEIHATRKNGTLKIKKDHQSLFRVIDIKTLRKEYIKHEPSDSSGTKKPHERRQHTRTFRSDRYTKMKGETIIIDAKSRFKAVDIVTDKEYDDTNAVVFYAEKPALPGALRAYLDACIECNTNSRYVDDIVGLIKRVLIYQDPDNHDYQYRLLKQRLETGIPVNTPLRRTSSVIDQRFRFEATRLSNQLKYDETSAIVMCCDDTGMIPFIKAYKAESIRLGASNDCIDGLNTLILRVMEFQQKNGYR